ncbi:MAG TPA: long-chain fatty acid--CoA ligase [Bacteroidia bacterium]|nr:long-chain fatty acid--CoA ligase [Bacteroidia bacterium]
MEPTRVFDLLDFTPSHFGNKADFITAKENGKWVNYDTETIIRYCHEMASGFIGHGLQRGERVAILANNRPEWNITDFAVQLSGAVLVPVYPTISEHDLNFILKDCEARFVFVSNNDIFLKTKTACAGLADPPRIFCFDEVEGGTSWKEVMDTGKKNPREDVIGEVKKNTKPGDMFTILYTSGTTGTPKGVMLSHRNLVSNFTSLCDLPPVDETSRVLSFLPLNHIYERMLVYLYFYKGPSIYYAESLEKIAENIREVKPHMFTCVPHLVQKVYNGITAKGAEQKGIKRWLFFTAVEMAEKFEIRPGGNSFFYRLKMAILGRFVFSKWRAGLGGNLRVMVSGGAALEPKLARIFWAAGLPVLEGYGLTETSPVIAVNNFGPDNVRFGTVGPVIKGVEVKFAEDGEILVKGPNVMLGYYKRPDATAEVIDKDGYFHTGDIGEMMEGKFLRITDRKKEIFKTSGGKYIAPQLIENLLRTSRFVEQAMVIGENRKFPAALIVPSFTFLRAYAKYKGIQTGMSNEELISNETIRKRIEASVEKLNAELAQYEKVKKIILIPSEWTVNSAELTPKLSLRRKVILKNNEAAIEKMYEEADRVSEKK